MRAALAEFEKLGATLVDVSLPRTELSILRNTSSRRPRPRPNLSRFDGVRYGHRAAKYTDLVDMYASA